MIGSRGLGGGVGGAPGHSRRAGAGVAGPRADFLPDNFRKTIHRSTNVSFGTNMDRGRRFPLIIHGLSIISVNDDGRVKNAVGQVQIELEAAAIYTALIEGE